MNRRLVINLISLSRLPLSIFFIFIFQPNLHLLIIALLTCFLILLTDLMDGYLARKFNIESVQGRLFDALGDKSFYVAIVISFNSQCLLEPVICWGIIVREIAMYIVRIARAEKMGSMATEFRGVNWYGCIMFLVIISGFYNMYTMINFGAYNAYFLHNILGVLAFFVGTLRIFVITV